MGIMSTFYITLSESLRQFVAGQIAERGLAHSDQYFEQLLEEALLAGGERQKLEEHYREKAREGLANRPQTER